MSVPRSFVGFGFGPIQSGLFLLEAWKSGRFSQFTVAEVDAGLVAAVNAHGGRYRLNIAHSQRIETCEIPHVRMLNPRVPADRAALVQAVREADELATALPRVEFYEGDDAAVVSILCDARNQGVSKPQVLYAAENHNHAAEILTDALSRRLPAEKLANFQVVNTVIGKMSGVLTDPAEMARLGLTPMVPGVPGVPGINKAILVEAFNRILISQVTLPGFQRGITVFEEKSDLLPFEEAKLYGHNAIHALLGYLAHARGLNTMAQLTAHPDLLAIGRQAFLEESGQALCRKYATLGDPLFTPAGFAGYAEDLLERMVNPNLNDRVERVIRDPQRKLAWTDRLYGTMRLALGQRVTPRHMARGAAGAVRYWLGRSPADRTELAEALRKLWGPAADATADELINLTWEAMRG